MSTRCRKFDQSSMSPEDSEFASPDNAWVRALPAMFNTLVEWSLQFLKRETWLEKRHLKMTGMDEQLGVLIGYWDEKSAEGRDPKILPVRKSL